MKTAVVTGASGGIGLETARAAFGRRLAGGVPKSPCLSVGGGAQHFLRYNGTAAQVQAAFAAVDRVDLLVNNAGFGISGAVEHGEAEMRRQFDLNFFAWVTVIQAALPALRESRGRILNISSAAAVFSIPFQSFYSATKAAVERLDPAPCAASWRLLVLPLAPCGWGM